MNVKIKINGVTYSNVGTLTPSVSIEYAYSVQTMDGKLHQSVKGKKTNYTIIFYNSLDGVFYELKNLLAKGEKVLLTVPKNATEEYTSEYYPEIKSYSAKGRLNNGEFFYNALKVVFDKVDYDE